MNYIGFEQPFAYKLLLYVTLTVTSLLITEEDKIVVHHMLLVISTLLILSLSYLSDSSPFSFCSQLSSSLFSFFFIVYER